MATDIGFDPINRELLFNSDGSIAETPNASVQNGAILLEGRVFNISQPQAGIGFNSQVQGGPKSQAALQLNRWVSQVQSDNGVASWQQKPTPPGQDFDFNASVKYL